jgi:hypothetical protein
MLFDNYRNVLFFATAIFVVICLQALPLKTNKQDLSALDGMITRGKNTIDELIPNVSDPEFVKAAVANGYPQDDLNKAIRVMSQCKTVIDYYRNHPSLDQLRYHLNRAVEYYQYLFESDAMACHANQIFSILNNDLDILNFLNQCSHDIKKLPTEITYNNLPFIATKVHQLVVLVATKLKDKPEYAPFVEGLHNLACSVEDVCQESTHVWPILTGSDNQDLLEFTKSSLEVIATMNRVMGYS